MNDKRTYPRFSLWFPVVVEGSASPVWAICHDASSGGILISGAGAVEVGAEVTIAFRVAPDDEERVARGRVVRIEERGDNPREVWSHRIAVEFLEPQLELQSLFQTRSSPPPPQ